MLLLNKNTSEYSYVKNVQLICAILTYCHKRNNIDTVSLYSLNRTPHTFGYGYIPYAHTLYIYIAQSVPIYTMHIHALQNKASSLGGTLQRLYSLLSRVHPTAGSICEAPICLT